mgnify:CR=1 FL=1
MVYLRAAHNNRMHSVDILPAVVVAVSCRMLVYFVIGLVCVLVVFDSVLALVHDLVSLSFFCFLVHSTR